MDNKIEDLNTFQMTDDSLNLKDTESDLFDILMGRCPSSIEISY